MSSTLPSWDLFITLFFIIGLAYGFILQRERIVATLMSVYAALVVSQLLVEPVGQFFKGDKTLFNQIWIRSDTSPFTIHIALFVGIIVLLSAKGGINSARGRGAMSHLEVLIYSALNTALIVSSIFSFLPEPTRDAYAATSNFVKFIVENHDWWLGVPVAALIVFGFQRHNRRSTYEDD
jgi:hypothetical protein